MRISTEQLRGLENAKLFKLSLKESEKAKSVVVAVRGDKKAEIVFCGTIHELSFATIAIIDKYLEMFSEEVGVSYGKATELFAVTIMKMSKELEEVGKNGIQ